MTVETQRPSSFDVTRVNPRSLLYLRGDENTDESIRFAVDDGDIIFFIETRADGVWNDGSLRTRPASIEIGRDLKIEAAAEYIKTDNPSQFSNHDVSLIPHIPYSPITGTGFPHTPIVDAAADNVIFSTAVSEVSGTTISQPVVITDSQLITSITYETGTVGAVSEIQHTVYSGADNTGDIVHRVNLLPSDFVAGTSATIEFGSSFGFSTEYEIVFIEMISATAFTLKTDATGNILMTLSSQSLEIRGLLYEDLIFDESLGLVLTSDLNPVYSLQFPG